MTQIINLRSVGARRARGEHLVLARQPIFDSRLQVWGYELLFRDQDGVSFDGDAMTAKVLLRVGLDVGLENLVGKKKASINVTRPYLVGDREVPLPPEQTVLEITPTIERDAALVDGAREMCTKGYLLALDDYVYQPGDEPLLELVNVIKIDVLAAGIDNLESQVESCCRYGALLVAEKVETTEQLEAAKRVGFHLFQGHLLSRPFDVTGRTLTPSRVTCLRLLQRLCDPGMGTKDVEKIIETDPALAMRFLRAAGAGAAGGLRRKVSSIREGAVLLGRRRLKSWVMLMLLADSGGTVPEQLVIAMTRARMCELIAEEIRPGLADSAFTVGLISSLDLLLGAPLVEIVGNLSITDELVAAVLEGTGRFGHILSDVKALELGLPLELRCGVPIARLESISLEALCWATEVCQLAEG